MVRQAVVEILPFVFGLIAAPLPVAAVILLLMAKGGRGKALAFVVVWVAVVFVLCAVVALATGGAGESGTESSPAWVGWIQLVIGLLLLALAIRALRQHLARPKDAAFEPPTWLSAIDSLGTVKVVGLSALLSGVNPKNLAMVLGAGAAVGSFGLGAGEAASTALVFAVLGSLGLIVPFVAVLATGSHGTHALERARIWLIANNDTVTMTVLFVFGAVLASKGLRALVG
ncbi:GAP family protein [Nocardiopsis synnemataformans]|uniref:GAP family protein n=1 Tax=Nocardiopsis synnemataformans TaxID=61305 RepID=UPI003EB987FF